MTADCDSVIVLTVLSLALANFEQAHRPWDAEHRIILHDLMSAFEHELHAAQISEGCPHPMAGKAA
jgi:hypothetical protein